ncbi:tetratricopeptide repeat protein [uncultured Winogradskyella sp.]|uniref:tetratricopeptide repeat protein n=1 Tax=uncultured Winogradskyella sp. TaxID=395353 RepID=UPI00260D8A4F|nr:tetratricopeptide repeat protein [uncultured Winogradskyella sp.]
MKKYQIAFLTCFFCLIGFAQNLDSLLVVARQTVNDSAKIRMYNKIGFRYIFNDSDKAIKVLEEGVQLANSADFQYGLTELINTKGIYMDVMGKSDSAQYYFEKALKISQKHQFKSIEALCINNLGMFNWNRGNFDQALDYFFQSLKKNESLNQESATANALNNIGLIYQEMYLNEKALEYHRRALSVREKYNLENDQIASLNNIGINLKELGRIGEAIEIYKTGIDLAIRKNNNLEYHKLLDNLANAYNLNGDTDLALQTYFQVIEKTKEAKANEKALLSTYNNVATLYNDANRPIKALNYINEGFLLVEKYPESALMSADLYLTGAESYYILNNFNKARAFKSQYIALKDSIFSEKNAKAIADLEIKYETEKNQKQILIQRAELAEQDLIIQKRNYQIYGLIGLVSIFSFIGYLFYNQQRLKNHQLEKEKELNKALIKIETQNKLQEQRLSISRDLHDNIGAQLTFIISSIDNIKYAFKLEDEKLKTKLSTISDFASSTIYELRDTIWAMNKNEITFEDLQVRISNFIDKANLAAQNIDFQFNVDKDVNNDAVFSSVQGMNIYRITQEAIHNTLKYAKASKINVEIYQVNNHIRVSIKDDGIGFNDTNTVLGNGIRNMKKRAHELGGNLSVETKENKGTSVTLFL